MMSYALTVIVPVYNRAKCLSESVNSVIAQPDFSEIQLILSDDGSTDGSAVICDEYASKYDNILAIHNVNSGVAAARNRGIELAEGEWLAFLDSDDYLKDGIYTAMLSVGEADLVCCDYATSENENGNISRFFKKDYYGIDDLNSDIYSIAAGSYVFYQCWNKLYKTEIVKKNFVKFPEGCKIGEDMRFVLTYLKYVKSFAFVRKPLYFYNVYDGNTTSVVNNSFDCYLSQYEWKRDFFTAQIPCDAAVKANEDLFKFESVEAVKSIGAHSRFFDGLKQLRRILKNDEFLRLYDKSEYDGLKSKYEKKIHYFIEKKSAFVLLAFMKAFTLFAKYFMR